MNEAYNAANQSNSSRRMGNNSSSYCIQALMERNKATMEVDRNRAPDLWPTFHRETKKAEQINKKIKMYYRDEDRLFFGRNETTMNQVGPLF